MLIKKDCSFSPSLNLFFFSLRNNKNFFHSDTYTIGSGYTNRNKVYDSNRNTNKF